MTEPPTQAPGRPRRSWHHYNDGALAWLTGSALAGRW